MDARRPWRLEARFLAALALAAGALAWSTPGAASTTASALPATAPAVLQAPADLPEREATQVLAAAPPAPAAASGAADSAPEPGLPYLLALMAAGLLGGYRRARS